MVNFSDTNNVKDYEPGKFKGTVDDKIASRVLQGKQVELMYGFVEADAVADGRAWNASFFDESLITDFQNIHFFHDGVEAFSFFLAYDVDKKLGFTKIEPDSAITKVIYAQGTNFGSEPIGTHMGSLFSVGGANVIFSILQDASNFFTINGNKIVSLVSVPKGTCPIAVQAIGDGTQYTKLVEIVVERTALITNVNISNLLIEENAPAGTTVGNLSTTGGELPITYTIISQQDQTETPVDVFEVVGDVLKTKAAIGPAGTIYTVIGQAEDSRSELPESDRIFTGTFQFTVVENAYVNTFSLSYNGVDEYLNCGNNASLWGNQKFSFSAWIKPNSTGINQYVASQFDGAGFRSWGLRINPTGTVAVIYSQTGTATDTTTTPGTITFGAWQLVSFSFDGTLATPKMKIWINDTLEIDEDTALTAFYLNSFPMLIAALGDSLVTASNFYSGLIDEPAIYSDALDQTKITEIYNLGVPVNLMATASGASLISWWRSGDFFQSTFDPDQIGVNDGIAVNMNVSNKSTDVPL